LVTERVARRLTAILAADVAGYSRLMGVDEEGTLAQLKAHRQALVDPKITEHRGRIVKTTGDGMLVEFASVVDALRCAVEVQRGMAERNAEVPEDKRIEFRVGINVGDIIIDGGDIYGDGVNVAARLEGLAEPGGICVSGRVQEDAEGKVEITFENAGEQQLKNIARPVRVYRVRLTGAAPSARSALPLPDRPSIAVLPFQNMSGDPEQDYFADGIVEEIITALSHFRQLFVIARNSSFTYKDRAVDVKQVGRELGVRYVLEGSMRKSGTRVRITGQLIDTTTSAHLWADRFDGTLEDIFELQDKVAASVVAAIGPKLERAEIERSSRKPTGSLDAYDYYLRGMASLHQWRSRDACDRAIELSYKAIELDSDFATPYGIAALCFSWRKSNSWMVDREQEIEETARLIRRAAELGQDDAAALAFAGYALTHVLADFDGGAALLDRALLLNPNMAVAWHLSGWVRDFRCEPEPAIKQLMQAIRLSPLDPELSGMHGGMALAHFLSSRYDEAVLCAEKGLHVLPNYHSGLRTLAASHGLLGQLEQAHQAVARLRQIDPALRVSTVKEVIPFRKPEALARYEEGLRKAGLPE